MSVEYNHVSNHAVSRRIHFWRRLRQCCAVLWWLTFIFGLWAGVADYPPFFNRVSVFWLLCAAMILIVRCVAQYQVLRAWTGKDSADNLLCCPQCEYDLRAHDVSSCPECGYELDKQLRHEMEVSRAK
tara:strand:- start:809 stop:1192 length:384 start_codon:yes stop_codon:yes gene_type:complete